MYQITDLKIKNCTSKQAASLLEVTTRTIQLWSESGILKAWKTARGHRRFNLKDIEAFKIKLKEGTSNFNDFKFLRVLLIEDESDLITLYWMAIVSMGSESLEYESLRIYENH
jgi:excisionase family DNA binding protein